MYPSPPPPAAAAKLHPPYPPIHHLDMPDLRHPGMPIDHTPAWMHSMAPDRRRLPPPPPSVAQHPYPAENPAKSSRVVIPSKRAAQNRAAQRAFRQRRDRYVKDLEKKSKEMESWPDEMERLRSENSQLRSTVATLERRVAELTGQTPVSSNASCTGSAELQLHHHHQHDQSPPASPPQPNSPGEMRHASPLLQAASPLLPVSLRAPQSFTPPASTYQDDSHAMSDTTNPQQPAVVETSVTENAVQPSQQHDVWAFDNFELEFAFDSFYRDDFANNPQAPPADDPVYAMNANANSGQVLDDLFEVLQRRQRPQIPVQPAAPDMAMQSSAIMMPYPVARPPLPQ